MRSSHRWGRALRTGVVLLVGLAGLAAGSGERLAAQESGPIPFAAGPRGGFYQAVALTMERQLDALEVRATQGSFDNLRRLEEGEVRFAFAQQDVVSEHFHEDPGSSIRVVGRVFYDSLHILVRRPIHVESARDFQHLRVWPGEPESGTRYTAERFLESAGLPLSALHHPVEEVAAELARTEAGSGADSRLQGLFERGDLDALMLVTVAGSPSVCELMGTGDYFLFPLDYKTLRIFTTEDPPEEIESSAEEAGLVGFRRQVSLSSLPERTYPYQRSPIPTVAVPVLLVTRQGEDVELAKQVLATAKGRWEQWRPEDPECRPPATVPTPSRGQALPQSVMLPGIEVDEPWWPRVESYVWPIAWALLLLALGGWAYRKGFHWVVRDWWIQERVVKWVLLVVGASVLVITLATHLIEKDINENFSNFFESFWSITIYLFSGLEDRTPYRPWGRFVAALGLLLGPLFFALLTGWLARFFIQWEKRMPQNLKGHYLILNWSERAHRVIRELRHPVLMKNEMSAVVVVLTDDDNLKLRDLKEAGTETDSSFEDVFLSIGDPTSERALLNANAQDARTIVILADDRRAPQSDDRTLRSLMMLRRIAREHQVEDLQVVVELVDAANEEVVAEMARDFPGSLEQISGVQVRTCLLAQAALSSGVVEFYSDLLRVSDDTNEVYSLPIPEAAVGLGFREYAAQVVARSSDNPLIPVGVQRTENGRHRMFSNPRPGKPGSTLEQGDELVVVAYEPPVPTDLPQPATPAGG